MRFLNLLTLIILVFIPFFVFGQMVDLPFAFSNELNVEFSPTYPRPNEQVLITLSLYSGDLSTADISWYEDGRLVQRGRGLVTYLFTAGNTGERKNIELRIALLNGVSFTKQVNFNPASVDIVWEAISYTPPFYKGKALHARQGTIKVVAMPEFVANGVRIPSDRLVYNWSNGLQVLQSQSGYGKSAVYINGSLFGRTENIEVMVTDPINNLVAKGRVNISPVGPEIIFYKNDPYYGPLFENALSSDYDLKTEEFEMMASPFFFSKEDMPGFTYNWKLNGNPIDSIKFSRNAVFRKPEGSGRSMISLAIENQNKILQGATKNLTLIFDN